MTRGSLGAKAERDSPSKGKPIGGLRQVGALVMAGAHGLMADGGRHSWKADRARW